MQAEVKGFWKSEAGGLVIYFIGVVTLAAILMPWMYQLGMWLARLGEAGEVSGVLRSIGRSAAGAAEKGKISRFFARALMVSAILLLPALLHRLNRARNAAGKFSLGLRALPATRKALYFSVGMGVSSVSLWMVAMLLEALGAFRSTGSTGASTLINEALLPAVATALVGEWLFRGLLVGIWLRAQSAVGAVIGTSVLFAAVHPLPGLKIPDPGAPAAGFEFLAKMISLYADPKVFIAELLTLFTLGLLLGWARVRTQSLWLPIGLHAGIVFAFKAFNIGHERIAGGQVSTWWVGMDLRAGLVPLASILLIWLLLKGFLQWDAKRLDVRP